MSYYSIKGFSYAFLVNVKIKELGNNYFLVYTLIGVIYQKYLWITKKDDFAHMALDDESPDYGPD